MDISLEIDKLYEDKDENFRKRLKDEIINTPQFHNDGEGIMDFLKYPQTESHVEEFPDLYKFNFYGFKCYIIRRIFSTWCGYLKINKNHPVWETDIERFDVSGGITYDNPKTRIIGFDTCHYDDLSPFNKNTSYDTYDNIEYKHQTYKDRDYMILNLKYLALQIFVELPEWSKKTHSQFPKQFRKRLWNIYKLWYLRKGSKISSISEKGVWEKIVGLMFEEEKKDKHKKLEKYDNKLKELYLKLKKI
jgi:hypothetical protein